MSSSMAPPAALGNTSPVQLGVPTGSLGAGIPKPVSNSVQEHDTGKWVQKGRIHGLVPPAFYHEIGSCAPVWLWTPLAGAGGRSVSLHRVQGSWQYSGLDSAALLVLFFQPLSQIPWWTLYGWWKQECSWNGSEWVRGEWSPWGAAGASGKLNPCGFTHGSLYLHRSCPVLPWLSVPPSGHVSVWSD